MYLRDIDLHLMRTLKNHGPLSILPYYTNSCCMINLYIRQLGYRIAMGNWSKIVINLNENIPSAIQLKNNVYLADRVCSILYPFDPKIYDAVDNNIKKRMMLDAIHESCVWVCREIVKKSDAEFQRAYVECIALDLEFKGFYPKKWISPDKQYEVKIAYEMDLEDFHTHAVLIDRKSKLEVARKPIFRAVAERYLHESLKWTVNWMTPLAFNVSYDRSNSPVWRIEFDDVLI